MTIDKTNKKFRELSIKLPEDVYSQLEEMALKNGFSSISDYAVFILINTTKTRSLPDEVFEKIKSRLDRHIQSELNKGLSVIETIKKQIVELYEKIDELKQRIDQLERDIHKPPLEKPRTEQIKRKTAIERLKEEKIVFESTLSPRIQRDRLFAYFERMSAVVLKLSKERVAVDPEFWKWFKDKLLNEVSTNREEEIRSILGDKGFELWKILYSDNVILFDSKTRKWKFIHGEVS